MRAVVLALVAGVILVGVLRTALFLAYAGIVLPSPRPAFQLEGVFVHFAWRAEHGRAMYPEGDGYPYTVNLVAPFYSRLVGAVGRLVHADISGLMHVGRTVSFLASLAAAAIAVAFLYTRQGRLAAMAGASFALGSAPMVGFAVMTRPDALADLLGLAGFLSACYVRGSRRSAVAAGILLGLACLTKQTAGVYVVAAALALWVDGRDGRRSILVAATAAATTGLIVALAAVGGEPQILASLFGQTAVPLDGGQRLGVLRLLARTSPELPWFAVLGCWLWTSGPFREPKLAVLAVVLLGAAFVTSAKLGSDLNYFLGLRFFEVVVVGTLCRALVGRAPARSWQPLGILAVGLLLSLPSVWHVAGALRCAEREASFRRTAAGQQAAGRFQVYRMAAENPAFTLFTDSDRLAVYQGDRAAFVDAYLFRLRVTEGHLHPSELIGRIASRRFELIVLSADVNAPSYGSYFWRLPPDVTAAVREHYLLRETGGGFYVYAPKPDVRAAGPTGRACPVL
jgi:hypothetical protein